jgi:hypothetical protein
MLDDAGVFSPDGLVTGHACSLTRGQTRHARATSKSHSRHSRHIITITIITHLDATQSNPIQSNSMQVNSSIPPSLPKRPCIHLPALTQTIESTPSSLYISRRSLMRSTPAEASGNRRVEIGQLMARKHRFPSATGLSRRKEKPLLLFKLKSSQEPAIVQSVGRGGAARVQEPP